MLRALPGWGQRLSYQSVVSALPAGAASAWSGATGYLHDFALQRFGTQLLGMEIYFAGPPVMASAVQRMLLEAKVPSEQTHFDQFY